MINCNITSNNITGQPIGETDSFGGAGSGQFGGYDGKVHKSWTSELSLIKTNQSIINKNCEKITGQRKIILGLVPLFFILGVVFIGLVMIFNGIKKSGLLREL